MGITGTLSKSGKPGKKYQIELIIHTATDGDIKKIIHFGQAGAEDFTMHQDPERKERYVRRHRNIMLKTGGRAVDNVLSPAFWAMNLLWNKPTLTGSIADVRDKYKIVVKV
jgi:Family of unknown function (DUF5754)